MIARIILFTILKLQQHHRQDFGLFATRKVVDPQR